MCCLRRLLTIDRREIGLWLAGFDESPDLGIGTRETSSINQVVHLWKLTY